MFLLEYKETPVTESKVAKEEKFAREILSNNLTYWSKINSSIFFHVGTWILFLMLDHLQSFHAMPSALLLTNPNKCIFLRKFRFSEIIVFLPNCFKKMFFVEKWILHQQIDFSTNFFVFKTKSENCFPKMCSRKKCWGNFFFWRRKYGGGNCHFKRTLLDLRYDQFSKLSKLGFLCDAKYTYTGIIVILIWKVLKIDRTAGAVTFDRNWLCGPVTFLNVSSWPVDVVCSLLRPKKHFWSNVTAPKIYLIFQK